MPCHAFIFAAAADELFRYYADAINMPHHAAAMVCRQPGYSNSHLRCFLPCFRYTYAPQARYNRGSQYDNILSVQRQSYACFSYAVGAVVCHKIF